VSIIWVPGTFHGSEEEQDGPKWTLASSCSQPRFLVRPLHATSMQPGAWAIDIAEMHAARCLFDVARDSWSLREGYSAKKAETGTLQVIARDPNFS